MRKINYIVVHCSATREGCTLTSEALEAEHRRRGFRTTGYHYYIRRDGTVLGTRSLELPGAHCRGHNKYSIGIWNYENKQRNLERYLENCGHHHCHHSQCAGRAGDATVGG